jgi:hypothetical protein
MALRLEVFRRQGLSFDEAFEIVSSQYTSDGMSLKPGAKTTAALMEARAI